MGQKQQKKVGKESLNFIFFLVVQQQHNKKERQFSSSFLQFTSELVCDRLATTTTFFCVCSLHHLMSLTPQSVGEFRKGERARARAAAVGLEADDEQRPLHTHTAEADTHIHVCIPAAELRGKEEV